MKPIMNDLPDIYWTDETGSFCALYVTNGGPRDEPVQPATPEDLCEAGYLPTAELDDMRQQLADRNKRIAELEAELADVKTLDAWRVSLPGLRWGMTGHDWEWCRLVWDGDERGFNAAEPTAARHAAAEWVRGQGK